MLKKFFKKIFFSFSLFSLVCSFSNNISAWSPSDEVSIKCYNDLQKVRLQYEGDKSAQSCIEFILECWNSILEELETLSKGGFPQIIYRSNSAGSIKNSGLKSHNPVTSGFLSVLEECLKINKKWDRFVYWEIEQPNFRKYYFRVLCGIYSNLCGNCVYWCNYSRDSFIEHHRDKMISDNKARCPGLKYPIVCFGETKKGVWWCIVSDVDGLKLVSY